MIEAGLEVDLTILKQVMCIAVMHRRACARRSSSTGRNLTALRNPRQVGVRGFIVGFLGSVCGPALIAFGISLVRGSKPANPTIVTPTAQSSDLAARRPAQGFGLDIKPALAVGASLSPTSMGVALTVLKQGKARLRAAMRRPPGCPVHASLPGKQFLGPTPGDSRPTHACAQVLNTPIGNLIVSAAVVDDVIALLLLSELTALVRPGGSSMMFVRPILAAVGFVGGVGYFAVTLAPALLSKGIVPRLPPNEAEGWLSVMLAVWVRWGPSLTRACEELSSDGSSLLSPLAQALGLMLALHAGGASHLLGAFLVRAPPPPPLPPSRAPFSLWIDRCSRSQCGGFYSFVPS